MPNRIPHETANDRFKQGFGGWFSAALVVATLVHAAIFLFSPTFAIDGLAVEATAMEGFDIPEVDLPPEPEPIQRPARPAIADVAVDTDVTIPPTTMDANPAEVLAPPSAGDEAAADVRAFTPMTVRPQLQNEARVARALVRLYPPVLRDAGIGGTVIVWCFIDEDGIVQRTQIDETSGYDALDRAALEVAEGMEFSPAYNRDQRVAVWVAIPVTFEAR